MSMLQNGYVVKHKGSRWMMLLLQNGMVTELEMSKEMKRDIKPGCYDLDFKYLGTEEQYKKQSGITSQ